jgi:hypothetical protein
MANTDSGASRTAIIVIRRIGHDEQPEWLIAFDRNRRSTWPEYARERRGKKNQASAPLLMGRYAKLETLKMLAPTDAQALVCARDARAGAADRRDGGTARRRRRLQRRVRP